VRPIIWRLFAGLGSIHYFGDSFRIADWLGGWISSICWPGFHSHCPVPCSRVVVGLGCPLRRLRVSRPVVSLPVQVSLQLPCVLGGVFVPALNETRSSRSVCSGLYNQCRCSGASDQMGEGTPAVPPHRWVGLLFEVLCSQIIFSGRGVFSRGWTAHWPMSCRGEVDRGVERQLRAGQWIDTSYPWCGKPFSPNGGPRTLIFLCEDSTGSSRLIFSWESDLESLSRVARTQIWSGVVDYAFSFVCPDTSSSCQDCPVASCQLVLIAPCWLK